MKVELKQDLHIKKAIVYFTIKIEEKRQDIQDFLNGKIHYNDPIINNRIKEYLKNLSIYDRNYNLTKLGEEVKKTGKIEKLNTGKFIIHYYYTSYQTKDKIVIVFLEPISPKIDTNDKLHRKQIEFFTGNNFILPIGNNELVKFKVFIKENDKILWKDIGVAKHPITLKWTFESPEDSYLQYKGNITKRVYNPASGNYIEKEFKIKDNKIPIAPHKAKANFEKIITSLFPTSKWDNDNKILKIDFDYIKGNKTAIKSLKISKSNLRLQQIWKVSIMNLPIGPINEASANNWIAELINIMLEKNYTNPADLNSEFEEIKNKKEFKNLATIKTNDIIRRIKNTYLSKNKKIFWHLLAPMDVIPKHPAPKITKIKSFPEKQKIAIKTIKNAILSISRVNENEIKYLIYYDKYVRTPTQIKNVKTILNNFIKPQDQNKIIITSQKGVNEPQKVRKALAPFKVEFIENLISSNERIPHDRYIILISNSNQKKAIVITNSTDFFKETNKSGEYKVEHTTTFSEFPFDKLPSVLKKYIDKNIKL